MAQYQQSFITTPDGANLYLHEWTPDKSPKAVVLYIHGLGSHGGRLDHWARRFAAKKIAFVAYDQRGHGRSDGKRGHPKHIRHLMKDVQYIVQKMRERFPGKPLILYGHSMGGNIALNYVIESTARVDALIATSPWIRLVDPPPKALLNLIRPLSAVAPGISLNNGLSPEDISRDIIEVEKYRDDLLVHDRISVGLAFSVHEAGLNALKNAHRINIPFLIMHGTGDRITSHEASREYVMRANGQSTLKLWDDAYHELHHEPIRDKVFEYKINWMKQQKLL